ncbi:MAG: hypothetical protein HZA53_04550 [Planctomycetes bacterium]|nr:hypothetical protein [Planctomycetota bacterium]
MRTSLLLLGLWFAISAFAQRPAVEPAAQKPASVRYAMLPLRNLSADATGATEIGTRLRDELGRRGASFVPADELDRVLLERRVRYTDSLAADDARAIRAATGASFGVAGVLFDFARGDEPRIAVGLRVIDLASGERVQSAFVALRGQDGRGLLGLGAVEDVNELEERALPSLFAAFGEHGGPLVRPSVAAAARARTQPADTAPEAERVAVLPFINRSTRSDAGASFSEILAHEWFRARGVRVVEASELRAALRRARIRTLQEMDAATMASIGELLGVRWFALGSVDRFGEEAVVRDQRHPEIEVSMRVVDARTGLVAASRSLRLRGDAY